MWTSRVGRSRLVGRASDYLSCYFSAAMRRYGLASTGTVIVAKTDPPLISLFAAWVARLRGARLVNCLQDVFPELALELGVKVLRRSPRPRFRPEANWQNSSKGFTSTSFQRAAA